MFILEAETLAFWKQREEPEQEQVERKSPHKDDVEAKAGVASA